MRSLIITVVQILTGSLFLLLALLVFFFVKEAEGLAAICALYGGAILWHNGLLGWVARRLSFWVKRSFGKIPRHPCGCPVLNPLLAHCPNCGILPR